MKFKFLIIIQIIAALIISIPAFAEIKTVTHTLKQPFGGSQSPDDARTAGIARAKREALEQFGTYIESTTVVKNAQVDSDEILALTAGVTKVEVIKQKNYADGDAFGIEITVKMELDSAVLENSLKRLLEDRNHLKDLKDAREREKKLLVRIAELEKQNNQKGKTDTQSLKLKKEFQAASLKLTAIDWFIKADAIKYSDPEKAIEYLTEAIRLDPNYDSAYISRGNIYVFLKKLDRAITEYDLAIGLGLPNAAGAYNNRGNVYRDLKLFERAIADFDQAIRLANPLEPTLAASYSNRGSAYVDLKQLDRAITDFDQAIRLNPNLAAAYTNRGIAYYDLKQYERAIADCGQSIRLDPNHIMAYINRGNAYARLKKLDHAVADFSQAIRFDPNFSLAYHNRGFAYEGLKQFDRAIADYDQAIRFDQNDASAHYSRGNAYMSLRQFERAIADYDQAIRLDPNNAKAYTNRGISYNELKQFVRAIADFDQAIHRDPNTAEAYHNRGFANIMSSQTQKGCVDLEKTCKLGECSGYEWARQNKLCR